MVSPLNFYQVVLYFIFLWSVLWYCYDIALSLLCFCFRFKNDQSDNITISRATFDQNPNPRQIPGTTSNFLSPRIRYIQGIYQEELPLWITLDLYREYQSKDWTGPNRFPFYFGTQIFNTRIQTFNPMRTFLDPRRTILKQMRWERQQWLAIRLSHPVNR